ncbi:hypothetical protein E4U41_002957, partial [Claviceps citrina]
MDHQPTAKHLDDHLAGRVTPLRTPVLDLPPAGQIEQQVRVLGDAGPAVEADAAAAPDGGITGISISITSTSTSITSTITSTSTSSIGRVTALAAAPDAPAGEPAGQ